MNNFSQSYEQILKTLREIEPNINFLNQIRIPKLSDIELISVALTSEYLSIGSEYQLFRKLPACLSNRIERSVYNRRRRKLFPYIEKIRAKIANLIVPFEEYFIVDSMPLEVCKLSRSSRAKICRENYETSPNRGYCASQKTHYYGYKLHAVCSLQGVFISFDITKASVHDIHFLKNIKESFNGCTVIADKGYLSAEYQLDLFNESQIKLETPMKKNQHDYKPQSYVFRKTRKRIETLFSQLCDQFSIRRNYAKSFDGFKSRLLTKLTSLTIIQLINFRQGKKINNLKTVIT
jgi:hypothetical protein